MRNLKISNSSDITFKRPAVVSIGMFDGFHIGHQILVRRLVEIGVRNNQQTILLSFYPHPATVLGKIDNLSKICTVRQKIDLARGLGIDLLCLQHFTSTFSKLVPEDFIEKILFGTLNTQHLILGPDAAFGRGRAGNAEFIKEYFARHGRTFETISFVEEGSERISSQRIRRELALGNIEAARQMLGRPFAIDSWIVQGRGLGTRIGIPTANLKPNQQVLPANGVYATKALVNGRVYNSVTNVGIRPTFGESKRVVESHFLDYPGTSVYGERLELKFMQKIRPEIKFAGVNELVTQIKVDIETARKFLG